MDEMSSFNAFKLCWDIIFQETDQCEKKFFNSQCCKVLDSRDNNFNAIENRLAYTYRYGYFNILFFEKCFLLFIEQCSNSNAFFPFDNLRVCSLSNGPGFDIIGLLSALRCSNKPLKCLPMFNAINVYESWSELYKTLICKTYETCIVKSFPEYFHLNPMNVNFMQGDIYSDLSPEAKTCISNSNVLLMVNVFVSSKASPTTFENSLKELFTLLQPESLIFFIGSKNNMKLFSKLKNLKQYVKCVYGPQEVILNDLPIDEQISNTIGAKPCNSGHAKFVVWQKKLNIEDEQYSVGNNVVDAECNNSDTLSETSISAIVQNCEDFNANLKSPDSNTEEIKYEISISKPQSTSQNCTSNSVENITFALSNIKFNHADCEEQKFNIDQPNTLQSNSINALNGMMDFPKPVNYSILQNNNISVVTESKIQEETNKINTIRLADETNNAIGGKISFDNQILNKPILNQNVSNKKSKKKLSLNKTEDQCLNGNSQNNNSDDIKTLQKKSSLDFSCENSVKNGKLTTFPVTDPENLKYTDSNVQSLLQRCDTLISKLEELTVAIKSELNSSRKADINKTQFFVSQTKNCHTLHHGCCLKFVHCCCCYRKFCKH